MKKVFFVISCLTLLYSCEDLSDNVENHSNEVIKADSNSDGIMNFATKELLWNEIRNGGSCTRATICQSEDSTNKPPLNNDLHPIEYGMFTSLLDKIPLDDKCLSELTKEEKDTILKDSLNYYEAFGYDNLVPNENFARLLNWKGEIIVNDSLYRITPIGTFCFSNATEQSSQIIENYYNQLITEDSISFNSNTYIQLTPDLILYNSFPELNTNDTENGTRALDLIPLKYFSSQSNGWV